MNLKMYRAEVSRAVYGIKTDDVIFVGVQAVVVGCSIGALVSELEQASFATMMVVAILSSIVLARLVLQIR